MKAIVTNIKSEYFYEIENIVNVQYANNYLIITKLEKDIVRTITYNSKEVLINIIGGEIDG